MKSFSMERMLGVALGLAVMVASVGVTPVAAQNVGDPITIVVPNLAPRNGVGDRFGKNVADELRDLINDLHTHQAVSGRNLTRVRRQARVSEEELYECLKVRQLAVWVNGQVSAGQEINGASPGQRWGLVLCSEYESAGNRQVQVNARFVGVDNGEEFQVPEFTASEREPDEAAQRILETFDRWQTQLARTRDCVDYSQSQQWDRALENCDRALEINPTSTGALYAKALILRETDRPDEALAALDALLEIDPMHENALKTAGIIGAENGRQDVARTYLDRYMELNPGDVAIRLAIARDIFNAGNPMVALEFAREGLAITPDDLTLHTYIGHFAAEAGRRAEAALNGAQAAPQAEGPSVNGEMVSPDVVQATADPAKVTEYYQLAADSYERVYDEQAMETDLSIIQRLITARFKLGQYDEAIRLGERVTTALDNMPETAVDGDSANVVTPQQKAALWDTYSRALQEADRAEDALAAIQRAREIGGTSAALAQRQAMLQLELGQEDQAVAALVDGVESGAFEARQAFNIVFANAYQEKFQRGQLDAADRLLQAAGPLAQEEEHRLARNFWRGYIAFEKAKVAHEPMTAASAARAKPLFEQALELFRAAQGYERFHPSANVPQLIENAEKWILVEDGLIKRGR